jgi:hypothetical protein
MRLDGKFIKPVVIRSQASQEVRALLSMRQNLVQQKVSLENSMGSPHETDHKAR